MSENEKIHMYDIPIDDPGLAAVSSIMDLEYMIRNQSKDEKIRTMLIIATAMTDIIINTGKYTFDEVMKEVRENSGVIRRIINRIKSQDP